jgi:signal peptidase I
MQALCAGKTGKEGRKMEENENVSELAPEENSLPEDLSAEEMQPRKPFLISFFEIFELITATCTCIVLAFAFLFQVAVVDGGSMQNTLQSGDRLFVFSAFYTPQKGDIVVVQAAERMNSKFHFSDGIEKGGRIIKRVIAVAGDLVEVKTNGDIYVNGVLEDGSLLGYETFEDGIIKYPTAQSVTVPEGYVFLAGDHRNVSLDSRALGVVDVRWIQGKALFRIFPLEGFGPIQ